MTRSKSSLYICLAFILGVFSFFKFPPLLGAAFLILGLALISVFWKEKKIVILGLCFLSFFMGWFFSYQSEARQVFLPSGEVSFEGRVVKEPEKGEKGLRIVLEGGGFGRVLVFAPPYPRYEYGDFLRVKGEVKKPPVFEDFNYRKHLAKEGIFSLSYNPEITLLKKNSVQGAKRIYSYILSFKDELRKGVEKVFSPPKNYIVGAMILGDKSRMPDSLKEDLNKTGLRHITAISGMHIIIWFSILTSLFSCFLSSKKSVLTAFLILFFFLIMVGFPVSGVRAGLMALSINAGKILGRKGSSIRLLVFVAFLMLVFNPLLLLYDAGFQLSFLASAGIIYFKNPIGRILRKVPFKEILAMTLSAQIFTLPILIYNFGKISLVALLSNVLVVPVLPFVMVLAFLVALISLFSFSLALFLSFPCQILLSYLVGVINFLAKQPWAFKALPNFHWFWLFLFYFLLFFSIKKGVEF